MRVVRTTPEWSLGEDSDLRDQLVPSPIDLLQVYDPEAVQWIQRPISSTIHLNHPFNLVFVKYPGVALTPLMPMFLEASERQGLAIAT